MMSSIARVVVSVAVLACVALLEIPSSADAPQTGPVTVRVAGLRSNDGQVGCALRGWASHEAIDELLKHLGAVPGNVDCSRGDP